MCRHWLLDGLCAHRKERIPVINGSLPMEGEPTAFDNRKALTTSNTSAILAKTSLLSLCNKGTERRKFIFSWSLWSPVLIMICWKTRLSKTQTLASVTTATEMMVSLATDGQHPGLQASSNLSSSFGLGCPCSDSKKKYCFSWIKRNFTDLFSFLNAREELNENRT